MLFDSIIVPLTRSVFLSKYWNKVFLPMPGQTGRFKELLSWFELDSILEHSRLLPPQIKLFQGGQPVDPKRYLTPNMFGVPRLDSGGVITCLAEGATLILDDIQELVPQIRQLTHSLQEVFHTDTYANLYASWHGQNAFDLHWDAQASFVVQVAGRKRWKVYGPTRTNPLKDDLAAPALPVNEPVWDGILEDGDALYLPRGWWHVAYPMNERSLHLTLSVTPPTGIDFMSWVTAKLRASADARADLPAPHDVAAQAAYLKAIRKQLNDLMDPELLEGFLNEWNANIRPSPHFALYNAPYDQFAKLTEDSRVRLGSLYQLHFIQTGDGFEFHAKGKIWAVPADLVPAFEMLRNNKDLSINDLSSVLSGPVATEKLLKAVQVLARAGIVLIESR